MSKKNKKIPYLLQNQLCFYDFLLLSAFEVSIFLQVYQSLWYFCLIIIFLITGLILIGLERYKYYLNN